MKYQLTTPVVHNDVTYSELTFREAETGDLMASDKFEGRTSKVAAILASMSDIPLPAFRKIKARDFKNIMIATAELMGEDEPITTGE